MITIKLFGQPYDAERIVRGKDYVIGYNGASEAFAMRGISDFTHFEFGEGVELEAPTETESLAAEMSIALAQIQHKYEIGLAELSLVIATKGGVNNVQ